MSLITRKFQTYYVEYYSRYLEEYEAALANASAGGGLQMASDVGEVSSTASVEVAPNDCDGGVLLGGGGGGGEDFSSNGTASFCAIM